MTSSRLPLRLCAALVAASNFVAIFAVACGKDDGTLSGDPPVPYSGFDFVQADLSGAFRNKFDGGVGDAVWICDGRTSPHRMTWDAGAFELHYEFHGNYDYEYLDVGGVFDAGTLASVWCSVQEATPVPPPINTSFRVENVAFERIDAGTSPDVTFSAEVSASDVADFRQDEFHGPWTGTPAYELVPDAGYVVSVTLRPRQ